ncbi:MAG: hypothetical protein KAQ84_05650, partial [Thermoplasmatales archaeon]|nr:hypothetical protein [Thermoplasmatales archaeon]
MRKIIALGIMLLFISMTISSSTGLYVEKQSIKPLSFGNILYVGGNGTGNYSKIQDAIDNASDGDTVFVYDDSSPYYENVSIYKSINLIGEDKNSTVIDGFSSGYIVKIFSDWVNVSGFTVQNSGGEWFPGYAGFNIRANYTTISNNIIKNNCIG